MGTVDFHTNLRYMYTQSHVAMYILGLFPIESHINCMCTSVGTVEGGSDCDQCDSGTHSERAHSLWQSFQCTKRIQNISTSTKFLMHLYVYITTTVQALCCPLQTLQCNNNIAAYANLPV